MTIETRLRLEKGSFVLNVAFEVPARGVTALFGPSGSGKTLTLRAMAGLEKAENGFVRIGNDVWQDAGRFVPVHERGVGYVFQEPSLFSHLSVRGNLDYALKRMHGDSPRLRLEEAADLLGIRPLLAREPDALSGGEKQRVALARALLSNPRVLFMDEPLASLDRAGKAELLPFLDRMLREADVPVVFVSHATEEVAELADHMVLMKNGSVQASGSVSDILTRLDLPLANSRDAESVIETVVSGHQEDEDLTRLEYPGGHLLIPGTRLKPGEKVRIRLRASDVSLTLERHADTSILNILPATVDAVSTGDAPHLTIRLEAGSIPILARVTRHSAHRLDLRPGRRVFAQIKSVALMA